MSERCLKILRNSIEKRERLVNDKDETDIEYIDDESNSIRSVFSSFCSMYNIDYTTKETAINNSMHSTFIETPEWIKLKRSVLNPHDNDNKCFQFSITLSLYHEKIGKNFCRISTIKTFIDNLNWENINFPPQEQDYQTFEVNNKSIALNVLERIAENKEKISHLYKSELNKTREKQVTLLIISDNEKQHYVAVKNLNSLLKDKNKCSKHFCINCFKKFRTRPKLKKHQEDC